MSLLLVISNPPYDGTDVAWNALRLADTALGEGLDVRMFLMNDAVDLAHPASRPAGSEFDLTQMLGDLIGKGAAVRLCKTCLTRCGIGGGDTIPDAQIAGMKDLVQWITDSDKVVSF